MLIVQLTVLFLILCVCLNVGISSVCNMATSLVWGQKSATGLENRNMKFSTV